MSDYDYLPASNGSGDAPLMHITAPRIVGATTLDVDSVTNVAAKFIGTYGNLLPSGLIDPSTKGDFKGHVSGSTLVIDGFEAGTTDVGNTQGQVIIIKPNSGWSNRVAAFLANMTNKGTPEAVTTAALTATTITATSNAHVEGTTTLDGTVSGAGFTTANIASNHAFGVYLLGAQTPTAGSFNKILYDTLDFDLGTDYDFTNHHFIIPENGIYQFSARTSAGTTRLYIALFVDDSEWKDGYDNDTSVISGTAGQKGAAVSVSGKLTAGQTVAAYIYGNSGVSALNASAATTYFTGFQVCKV